MKTSPNLNLNLINFLFLLTNIKYWTIQTNIFKALIISYNLAFKIKVVFTIYKGKEYSIFILCFFSKH